MQILSDNGILSNTMLSSIRRRLRRVTKPELKPRDLDMLKLEPSRMLPADNLNRRLLTNSTQVDFLLAFPQDPDSAAVAMATFLKEKNLSSTKRRWKRRRVSEHNLNELVVSIKTSPRICSFSSESFSC